MTDYFAFAVEQLRQEFAPAAVTAALQDGPRPCCADAAIVVVCDGDTDTWECWVCGRTWEAPCR